MRTGSSKFERKRSYDVGLLPVMIDDRFAYLRALMPIRYHARDHFRIVVSALHESQLMVLPGRLAGVVRNCCLVEGYLRHGGDWRPNKIMNNRTQPGYGSEAHYLRCRGGDRERPRRGEVDLCSYDSNRRTKFVFRAEMRRNMQREVRMQCEPRVARAGTLRSSK